MLNTMALKEHEGLIIQELGGLDLYFIAVGNGSLLMSLSILSLIKVFTASVLLSRNDS